jgi:hypothetical protein
MLLCVQKSKFLRITERRTGVTVTEYHTRYSISLAAAQQPHIKGIIHVYGDFERLQRDPRLSIGNKWMEH